MDLNKRLVLIEISNFDVELYQDFDSMEGFGLVDQIVLEEGIVVERKDEDKFRKHVHDFLMTFEEDE